MGIGIDHYPPNYLTTSPDRILKTIERQEEDLADRITKSMRWSPLQNQRR
jgi:hypothetical protein